MARYVTVIVELLQLSWLSDYDLIYCTLKSDCLVNDVLMVLHV